MPGSNARALEKAKGLAVDGLILDLEDAVSPSAKEIARTQVYDAARSGSYGLREVMVRVNELSSPWGREDVATMATSKADALLLPKVESEEDVLELEDLMIQHGAPDEMGIGCMIETPTGVLNAPSIATASSRVMSLVVGTTDLAQELRAQHTREREPFATSLSMCVLAARAAGIAVLDSVHINLDDMDEFSYHCQQGKKLWF